MLHQGWKRRGQGAGRQETGLAGVAHEGEGGVQSDQREPGSPAVQEVNGGDGTDVQALQGPGGQAAWCLESDCPKVGQLSTSELCSDWLAHQEHPPHFPRSPGGTPPSNCPWCLLLPVQSSPPVPQGIDHTVPSSPGSGHLCTVPLPHPRLCSQHAHWSLLPPQPRHLLHSPATLPPLMNLSSHLGLFVLSLDACCSSTWNPGLLLHYLVTHPDRYVKSLYLHVSCISLTALHACCVSLLDYNPPAPGQNCMLCLRLLPVLCM